MKTKGSQLVCTIGLKVTIQHDTVNQCVLLLPCCVQHTQYPSVLSCLANCIPSNFNVSRQNQFQASY